MISKWTKPPSGLDDLFDALGRFEVARPVLRKVYSLRSSQKLKIQWFPAELRRRLEEVKTPGTPLGAFFTLESDQGCIWFDRSNELGVLMVLSFHEMIHAVDETLWSLTQKNHSIEWRDKVQWESEKRAFYAQNQLIEEIERKHSGFKNWMQLLYPKAKILHGNLDESEILKIYKPLLKFAA